jgi:hypothetical protein
MHVLERPKPGTLTTSKADKGVEHPSLLVEPQNVTTTGETV